MINKVFVSKLIGRDLTEEETQTIEWVNGFEASTGKNLMGLMLAAHDHGGWELHKENRLLKASVAGWAKQYDELEEQAARWREESGN